MSVNKKDLDKLLKDFNWKCYLDNNKDLIGLIKTKQQAIYHFKKYGYKEGRKYVSQIEDNIKNNNMNTDNNSVLDNQIASLYVDNVEVKILLDKVTILMTYKNRYAQLLQSLIKFNEMYSQYNLEVIIVDDCSDHEENLFLLIQNFNFKIKLIKLNKLNNREWINPVIAYNIGIKNISEDTKYVIIQNAEIFHCNDIVKYTYEYLEKNSEHYLSFNVFNSPSFTHNNEISKIKNNNYYNDFVCKINYADFDFDYLFYCNKYNKSYIDDRNAYEDFLLNGICINHQCNKSNIFYRKNVIYEWKGWYNHHIYNNRNLHFLTAITYDKLKQIGGFCNDMKDGLWYDDDDFRDRINKVCNIINVVSDDYFGIHLHHREGSDTHHLYKDFNELKIKNQTLYYNNKKNNVIFCEPEPNFTCNYNIYNNNETYNIGLCFKVYVNENTNDKRYDIIDVFLNSIDNLLNFYDNLVIVGVIDCITTEKLSHILDKYKKSNIKLIYLQNNYGISLATNIGIEYLLKNKCRYIFCSDDDIIIKNNDILNIYIQNMINNNIHHFCYYPLDKFNTSYEIIRDSYIKVNGFSGCFYCFTEEVIRELGYLPVLDKKYGYEHECFTKKVIKYNYDIINSSNYITLNDKSLSNASSNSHSHNTLPIHYELPKYIDSDYWSNYIKKLHNNHFSLLYIYERQKCK